MWLQIPCFQQQHNHTINNIQYYEMNIGEIFYVINLNLGLLPKRKTPPHTIKQLLETSLNKSDYVHICFE